MTDSLQNIDRMQESKQPLKFAIILSFPLLIQACGNGPATETNPFDGGNNGGSSYTGNPPANQAVKDFQDTVWEGLRAENRCGQCHDSDGGQVGFVNEVDVNVAYANAISYIDLSEPSSSDLVTMVEAGHSCWESYDSVCVDSIERMIASMAGITDNTTSRQIQLDPPTIRTPGDSKNFPADGDDGPDGSTPSFEDTIYPLLRDNCGNCHYEEGVSQQQAPFFAHPTDVQASYEAAKPKINIDVPVNSRLVLRLNEGHNCWTDCTSDASDMETAIEQFAGGITAQPVDPTLITSKALTLADGIVASGGSRHEADAIALYEFKAGSGNTAFDTSGVEPALNLTLSPSGVSWLSNYGLDFGGGRVQGDTQFTDKIYEFVQSSGEYSIEAWVIPANVSQEDSTIIGYGPGGESVNLALSQTLYNYNFFNRTISDPTSGTYLSTEDAGELLQSALQHVVATYSVVDGRKIYLNGELINVTDPVSGSTSIANWDSSWAFVLGQNSNGGQTWEGKVRLAAIHNAALTDAQVLQNFDAGVGQKYFLLFSVSEGLDDSGITGCLDTSGAEPVHNCFVMMEVSRYDDYSYLFDSPTFINLDSDWTPPSSFIVEGLRIAVNGREAIAGQEFGHVQATVDSSTYDSATGAVLSDRGAVIELEKGPDLDEFFITFEVLASNSNYYVDELPTASIPPPDPAAVSDIGVRTFDEINATIAKITGIPITNTNVNSVFQQYRQQLPNAESADAFLSSHQMAIAQIALTSCSELVDTNPGYFSSFDFTQTASNAFDTDVERRQVIEPLLASAMNVDLADSSNNLTSQPDETEIRDLLGSTATQDLDASLANDSYSSLMTTMQSCLPGCDTAARTEEIVKGVCAAVVGSAAMLIQ